MANKRQIQTSLFEAFGTHKKVHRQPPHPRDTHVFCDLDGVLVDFDRGVQQLCGAPPSALPPAKMWSRIARAEQFYANLPWTKDGTELWEAIRHLTPDILTGVSMGADVAQQKYAWCKRELCVETNHVDMAGKKQTHERIKGSRREHVTNVITCWSKHKHMESGPGKVLIDDRTKFKNDWERKGGIFVHHVSTASTLQILRERGILKEVPTIENERLNKANTQETYVSTEEALL